MCDLREREVRELTEKGVARSCLGARAGRAKVLPEGEKWAEKRWHVCAFKHGETLSKFCPVWMKKCSFVVCVWEMCLGGSLAKGLA